jgi:hypothetical protein
MLAANTRKLELGAVDVLLIYLGIYPRLRPELEFF